MNICVICGESFEDSYDRCPICGCPRNRYTIAGLGFPRQLERIYILVGFKEGSGGQQYLSLMSKATGRKILAGKISAEQEGIHRLLLMQKEWKVEYFPMVYEIAEQSSEIVFLFEDVPGETLREKAEREYPLPLEEQMMPDDLFMEFASEKRIMMGSGNVELDTGNCIWTKAEWNFGNYIQTEDGFRLRDFGMQQTDDMLFGKAERREKILTEAENRPALRRKLELIVAWALFAILLTELFVLLYFLL